MVGRADVDGLSRCWWTEQVLVGHVGDGVGKVLVAVRCWWAEQVLVMGEVLVGG